MLKIEHFIVNKSAGKSNLKLLVNWSGIAFQVSYFQFTIFPFILQDAGLLKLHSSLSYNLCHKRHKKVIFITAIGTKFISHYYQKALSLYLALPWTLSKRLKCFVFFNARQWLFASSNAMQYLNPTYTGKILFSCLVPSLIMAHDTSSSFYFVILVKWSSISSVDDIVNCGFAFLTIQTCKW